MDLPRLRELYDYHKINPPVHISVARYLGVGDKDQKAKPPTDSEIRELMANFPQTPRAQ
jgi:hypothetical protein